MGTPVENLLVALQQAEQYIFEALEGEESALMRSYLGQTHYFVGRAAQYAQYANGYGGARAA